MKVVYIILQGSSTYNHKVSAYACIRENDRDYPILQLGSWKQNKSNTKQPPTIDALMLEVTPSEVFNAAVQLYQLDEIDVQAILAQRYRQVDKLCNSSAIKLLEKAVKRFANKTMNLYDWSKLFYEIGLHNYNKKASELYIKDKWKTIRIYNAICSIPDLRKLSKIKQQFKDKVGI